MSKKKPGNIEHATRAGELLRFFLDGGNDSKMTTPEEGAICAASKLFAFLSADEIDAFCEAAGFEWRVDAMGSMVLLKKGV